MPQRRARGLCPAKIVGACYAASMDLSLTTTPAATDQRAAGFFSGSQSGLRFRLRDNELKPRGSGRAGGVVHYPKTTHDGPATNEARRSDSGRAPTAQDLFDQGRPNN